MSAFPSPRAFASAHASRLVLGIALALGSCTSIPGGEPVEFAHGARSLSATLVLPPEALAPRSLLVFVHGDGPQDRTAHDYYRPIVERLRLAGHASLLWDKPGVGGSEGDWLSQSMADRQSETLAALAWVEGRFGDCGPRIGLIGFSQAGWVVPAVAADSDAVDFAIGIGFAIDWVEQGRYFARVRLRREGRTEAEIEAALAAQERQIALYREGVSRERFVAETGTDARVPAAARFGFATRNVAANALADHARLDKPLLVLLGEHDLNVDVRDTARQLAAPSIRRGNLDVSVLPGASHALLHSEDFDEQIPGVRSWLRLLWQGEAAFVPTFLDTLETWLERVAPPVDPSGCAAPAGRAVPGGAR